MGRWGRYGEVTFGNIPRSGSVHLPLLNIFGGCAMLGLCTYSFSVTGGAAIEPIPYVVVVRISGVIYVIRPRLNDVRHISLSALVGLYGSYLKLSVIPNP